MPKRQRPYYEGENYITKRRRYDGVSESRADALATENERNLTLLKMEVEILRAQVTILRREIKQLRPAVPKGTIKENRNFWLM